MNAPVTIPIDRIEHARAVEAAYIKRMAKAAADYAERPNSEWAKLAFLDALSFVTEDVLSDLADLKHDLRMSPDGFPLDDEGDTRLNAEKVYVPMEKLS